MNKITLKEKGSVLIENDFKFLKDLKEKIQFDYRYTSSKKRLEIHGNIVNIQIVKQLILEVYPMYSILKDDDEEEEECRMCFEEYDNPI